MFTDILFLIILIFVNAFFAASEIALISLNDSKIRHMAEGGNKKAELLHKLIMEPSRFLATIQIGITLAGFLASAFAAEKFSGGLVSLIQSTGVDIDEGVIKTISLVLITLILSYFTLVLGELVPKRLAMKKTESVSMLAARPLTFLSAITSPFVKLLTLSTNFFVRLFGVDPSQGDEEVTEEEIRMMVDVGEEKGAIHGTEREMIINIFDFNNKTADEIMTHRTDIVALPVSAGYEEIMELIRKEKYTRFPVYEESMDNIVGILHVKDLLRFLDGHEQKGEFDLEKIIRHPFFVPQSKKADALFRELQKNKTHMAIIIDEYGGTAGIVTIEDLMEEIVGNILDEYDEDEQEIEKLDDATYIISGQASLDMVSDLLDAELPVDEYFTLSGFVIGQMGRIPRDDERPEIEFNGVLFKVIQVEEKRIEKIKVCRTN